MAIEDIADTPGISPDFFSGPAGRQRPGELAGYYDPGLVDVVRRASGGNS
jgi:hypothetical protein